MVGSTSRIVGGEDSTVFISKTNYSFTNQNIRVKIQIIFGVTVGSKVVSNYRYSYELGILIEYRMSVPKWVRRLDLR